MAKFVAIRSPNGQFQGVNIESIKRVEPHGTDSMSRIYFQGFGVGESKNDEYSLGLEEIEDHIVVDESFDELMKKLVEASKA